LILKRLFSPSSEQGETRERDVVGLPVGNFGKGCKKGLPVLDFWYRDHDTLNSWNHQNGPSKSKGEHKHKTALIFLLFQLNITKILSFIGSAVL
jgi:hypothetical protein